VKFVLGFLLLHKEAHQRERKKKKKEIKEEGNNKSAHK